jgi:hypothetical protein
MSALTGLWNLVTAASLSPLAEAVVSALTVKMFARNCFAFDSAAEQEDSKKAITSSSAADFFIVSSAIQFLLVMT